MKKLLSYFTLSFCLMFIFAPEAKANSNSTHFVSCLKCSYQVAKTKAILQARIHKKSYRTYRGNYFVFDPVENVGRSFEVILEFNSREGGWLEIASPRSTKSYHFDALDAYNRVLLSFRDRAFSMKPPHQSSPKFKLYAANSRSSYQNLDVNEFLYGLVRGSVIFPMNHIASYDDLKTSTLNEIKVANELRVIFQLESLSGMLSIATKEALAKMLNDLPLQYTVMFKNQDTITFVLDCFQCSIPFLPLHETAANKNGIKIGSNRSNPSSGNTGERYNDIYDIIREVDAEERLVCVEVFTNSGNGYVSQTVCYYIYL